ncbi:MAG TPA: PPC domain-containing protein, partial [Myxococcota bacterium]
QDSDCARGFCDTGSGACVGCRGDDDCGADQGCDVLSRECVAQTGCDADADCLAPTPVCNIDRAICVECLANDDCSTGRCDVPSSTCIAGCADTDGTEPNDGDNAATIVAGGEHSGRICAGDVDEFVFEAEGAIEASINVDGGVLALTLLNSAGTALATSQGTVGIGGLPTGTYRLRVAGAASTEADYVLRLTVTPPEGCVELDSEPNNSVATASELPTTGVLRSGTICGDDIDLWSFDVDAGDDVTVTLVGGEGAGTATVVLESTSGAVLANGTTTAPARIDGAAAGTVIARVRSSGGDVGYSLRVTTSSAPPACAQTDAEPNDTAAQAIALVPGTAATGQICADDVDQYRFAANALDDLAVNITGSNVRVRVLNGGGSVVAEGTSSFTASDLAAGTYRIEVRGALATTETGYAVTVVLTAEPAADVCAEGGLEPDSATNARAIAIDGTVSSGRICAGDTDYFTFTLTETRTVTISTRFTDDDGDIDMRLKRGTETVQTAAGVGDEELITRSLTAGTYVVEVYGFQQAANTFTIAVTAAVANCTDDAFEPNDTTVRAAPISGRAISGTRCPGNDDFFALRLESGDSLDARLVGTGLTMSLLSSTGTVLQSDAADGSNRRLQVSSLAAGRYFVRLTGSATASATYTLTPTIVPSPSRCIDDGAEVNNTSANAYVVDAGLFADGSYDLSALTMCSSNPDFFALDIPAN